MHHVSKVLPAAASSEKDRLIEELLKVVTQLTLVFLSHEASL